MLVGTLTLSCINFDTVIKTEANIGEIIKVKNNPNELILILNNISIVTNKL